MLTALNQTMAFDALKALLGTDRVSTGSSDRELHSRDQSTHAAHLPDLVVWPESI
jgi:D-lactate dehydrogenase (cytochrome)